MMSQKMAQQSLRRLATAQGPARATFVSRLVAPTAVQTRHSTSSAEDPTTLLAKQRLNRPVSPHLTIYQPQITWIPSMFTRITGVALSGGLYVFSLSYLAAPLFNWHLESGALAASFAALPFLAKFALKFTAALPFTFHSFNGLRHLVWDLGLQFKNAQVAKTGWTVIGLTFIGAVGLALL